MTADHRKPAEIEAEIAAERARLSNDLETLQGRLTMDGLMDEVRLQVRGQINELTAQVRGQVGTVTNDVAVTLREQVTVAGDTISRAARRNPWPFAVMGVGLAWLAVSAALPEQTPRKRKPRIGMAPVKPATQPMASHYDSSPADMAANRLERDADTWADSVIDAESQPIPPYDAEPTWARDDDALTLSRR